VIDLHTHTTASDGRFAPPELVARAAAAGVTVLAVTDHDTVAGCRAVADACRSAAIEYVAGIEITAVRDEIDVHVLGYFIDIASQSFLEFLAEQRRRRIDRLRLMIDALGRLGITLDADALLRPAIEDPGIAAGRPWIAHVLVSGGHAADTGEAFDRWLSKGRPAFVPRLGAIPEEVIVRIHEAGGLASLAHPRLLGHDEWIRGLVSSGLDALEAYHSQHDADTTARYLAIAKSLGTAVSGGSDYHGTGSHGPDRPGAISLPRDEYERLVRLKPDATPGAGASRT
jgi:predicted metal-dependent phosphoesterase TrpH